jgi:hypothetical protein
VPKVPTDIRSLARAYTEANIAALGGIATGKDVEMEHKLRAIGMLLDRGWGKPQQDQTHEIKGEIKVTLRKMLDDHDE